MTDARGAGRRIVVLSVNHLRHEGRILTGGAEKYALQTIQALLDVGARVHIAFSGESIYDGLIRMHGRGRVTLEETGWINEAMSGDSRLEIGTILNRRRWFRQREGDTVLAIQQGGGGSFAASLVAGRLLGLRVISSIRQLPNPLPSATHDDRPAIPRGFGLWRKRLIWRRRIPAWCCDALIFNSKRVEAAHHRLYRHPRGRTRIIYNGEPSYPRPAGGRIPCRIACVGRVTEAKGADVLLEAFGRIAARHPDAVLSYFGDGPLIPTLESRAERLGLSGRVEFAGFRSNRDDIFRQVDICVQPSIRESMSNSVVEAMARGIPCVVTDVGGLPETIDHGVSGFVVPPSEAGPTAEAISRLLSDREQYRRFSNAAVARARRAFSLERVMAETVDTILGPERRKFRMGQSSGDFARSS
ncbi:MAG: glycosyltransferase family 4 protein [Planctomycetota bacterium]|nr:glycosyltransferase family 4 protein [Planctomycetota bacterium]